VGSAFAWFITRTIKYWYYVVYRPISVLVGTLMYVLWSIVLYRRIEITVS